MALDVVLGLDADGGAWPHTASEAAAEAGGAVTGPRGLVRLLEAVLGLGGPEAPGVRRLAAFRAKLAAADGPGRFWHGSLVADAFGTARLLLGWRDALTEAGWTPGTLAAPPPRLADLAAAEAAGPTLPPGPADRLRAVIAALRDDPPDTPPLRHLRLLDARAALPPGLQALAAALEAGGTVVEEVPPPVVPAPGDLGAAQGFLRRPRSIGAATGDGTLALVQAGGEAAAAEAVADLLATLPAKEREGTLIIAQRPTALLDAALRRRHLPRMGVAPPSATRGTLALLPLLLATRWAPFDAAGLLELAQMRSPIPGPVARQLRELLPRRPGRGGAEWKAALAEGLAEVEGGRREAAQAAVALWLSAPLHDPAAGMPLPALARLCGALAAWALRRAPHDPLMAVLAARATALCEAAQALGLPTLPRRELERLLDAVEEEGCPPPGVAEEAAPWAVVPQPGACRGRPRLLLWWGFDPLPAPPRDPWRADERAALAAAGCLPWPALARLRAASAAARRPLLATGGRAVLVQLGGEGRHPLADEFAPLLPQVTVRAEALAVEAAPTLLGVALPRATALPLTLPQRRAEWWTAGPVSAARAKDSATALEKLLGCPFGWAMEHRAGLYPAGRATLAELRALAGTLAHRLAERLLAGSPDPAAVEAAARTALPLLLEEEGAPLLHPAHAAELAMLHRRLPAALRFVAEEVQARGLAIIGHERRLELPDAFAPGEALAGTLDLLLEDAAGRPFVMDMKWSASRWYAGKAEAGQAFQLAVYARLAGASGAAYLLLPRREAVEAPGLDATWDALVAARRARAEGMAAGRLAARGNRAEKQPDPDGLDDVPDAPCKFCHHGRLCGQEALA